MLRHGRTSGWILLLAILTTATLRWPTAEAELSPAKRASPEAEIQTNRAIDRGFAWLTKAIRRNGTVSNDEYGQPDLSCTAITGLAILSEGSTPQEGRYADDCRRVLYAVLELVEERLKEGASGTSLVQRKIGRNADLFLAALFLSEAYGESSGDQAVIREVLRKLIDRVCQAQGPDGTWGDESWAPVLGTVMGWECLRSAHAAGFRIDASADLVAKALQRKLIQSSRAVKDEAWMHAFYKETASLRVLHSTPFRRDPIFDETVMRLLKIAREERQTFEGAGGEEYLAFYLVSECLIKEPRPNWTEWRPLVIENLVRLQNRDGSWTGHHCITDRTFCTAAALLTLVAPRLSLPLSEL